MSEIPTPGQAAYEAYCRVVYGEYAQAGDYADLTWGQQAAWDAAAQAVLARAAPDLGDTGFAPPGTYRQETPC